MREKDVAWGVLHAREMEEGSLSSWPGHFCHIGNVLSEDQRDFLGELVESGLEEAIDALKKHEEEVPPYHASQTTSEAAQDYLNLLRTAQRRVDALEQIKFMLEGA